MPVHFIYVFLQLVVESLHFLLCCHNSLQHLCSICMLLATTCFCTFKKHVTMWGLCEVWNCEDWTLVITFHVCSCNYKALSGVQTSAEDFHVFLLAVCKIAVVNKEYFAKSWIPIMNSLSKLPLKSNPLFLRSCPFSKKLSKNLFKKFLIQNAISIHEPCMLIMIQIATKI